MAKLRETIQRIRAHSYAPLLFILLLSLISMYVFAQFVYQFGRSSDFERVFLPDSLLAADQDGTFRDLSGIDLNRSICFAYPSAYFAEQFLSPQEAAAATHQPGASAAYCTQHLHLAGLDDSQSYLLHADDLSYSSRLYVNGELLAQQGRPTSNQSDAAAARGDLLAWATPRNGCLDIVLHISNFYHVDALVSPARIYLTSANNSSGVLSLLAPRIQVLITIGLLGAFALLLVGLFVISPAQRSNLCFACFCLAMLVREGVLSKSIDILLPALPWSLLRGFEYTSVPLAAISFILYLGYLFPFLLPRWLKGGTILISIAYALCTLIAPPQLFTHLIRPYQILLASLFPLLLARLIIRLFASREPSPLLPEQHVSLYGLLLLALATLNDVLYFVFYGRIPALFGPEILLGQSTTVLFALIQTLALVLGFHRAADDARAAERRVTTEKETLAELNRLKTEFLSNVSHELKTPLTVVSGYAQVSERQLSGQLQAEPVREKMRIIAAEADRLALMVGQVLDIARIEEGRMPFDMKPCRIDEIIHSAVQTHFPILNKNHNSPQIDLDDNLPRVRGDAARLTQVIVNLIANSIRFTYEGTIRITAEAKNDSVEVAVSDNGSGIAPERLNHIFERFNQSSRRGGSPRPLTPPYVRIRIRRFGCSKMCLRLVLSIP